MDPGCSPLRVFPAHPSDKFIAGSAGAYDGYRAGHAPISLASPHQPFGPCRARDLASAIRSSSTIRGRWLHAVRSTTSRGRSRILDGVGHQGDRLDGWVHGEFVEPARLEAVHPRVVPNIGSGSSELAELERIDVWGRCHAGKPGNSSKSLKRERIYAHQHHGKFEGDKVLRLTAQAAQFHAGVVHFREDAPWLGDLMAELLGFPGRPQ